MPTWLIGATRSGLQYAWALLIGWLATKGFELPADVPAWLDDAAMVAVAAAFTAVIQWLETRTGVLKSLGTLLMLGLRKPVYEPPVVARPRGYEY